MGSHKSGHPYGYKMVPSKRTTKKAKSETAVALPKLIKKIISRSEEKKEISNWYNPSLLQGGNQYYILGPLNACQQGNTIFTRNANKVKHNSIQINCSIVNIAASLATAVGDSGFVALILDRQTNGATPTFAQIYDISSAPAGQCFRNTNLFPNRFKVLMNEEYEVGCYSDAVASGGTGAVPFQFEKWIDLTKLSPRDREVFYDGNAGTVADIVSGGLFLVIASTYATVNVTSVFTINNKWRFTED